MKIPDYKDYDFCVKYKLLSLLVKITRQIEQKIKEHQFPLTFTFDNKGDVKYFFGYDCQTHLIFSTSLKKKIITQSTLEIGGRIFHRAIIDDEIQNLPIIIQMDNSEDPEYIVSINDYELLCTMRSELHAEMKISDLEMDIKNLKESAKKYRGYLELSSIF